MKKLMFVFFLAGMSLILMDNVWGAVFRVNNLSDLQSALTTAGNNGEDDTVEIASGTYNLTSTLTYFGREDHSILIRGAGAATTILDGGNSLQVLNMDTLAAGTDANADITVREITFRNGNETGSLGGGGLRIETTNAPILVEFCSFEGNHSTSNGGGVVVTPHFETVTLSNNLFHNNSSDQSGGGVYNGPGYSHTSLFLRNNIFSSNSANQSGGGIYYGISYGLTENNIFMGNSANDGGGWYGYSGELILRNNIFIRNAASNDGGAIHRWGDNQLTNNTIYQNMAVNRGGGIYIDLTYASGAAAHIYNNIIWGNIAKDGNDFRIQGLVAIVYLYYNDFNEFTIQNSSHLFQGNNINADPQFVDIPSDDYHLSSTSPCIDAGTSDDAPLTDMAGNPRSDVPWIPNTGGGTYPYYDMGALEYQYVDTEPPTGSILINGGAEATKSTAVTLTLTATDDTPGVIRMCVSNTATCTAWTAFAPTKSWTLTSGNGTKTVNVWFQDVWDNVNPTPYFDIIILDTIRPANGTVTATPGDTEVMLSWTGFEDTGSGIGSYKVVFAKGSAPLSCSAGTMIYSGADLSYTHTGLTNGTKYGYRVCAIDKVGNVSTGATASTKPRPEKNPPTGSITIKGGVEATKSTAVTLTLAASDDSPGAIRMCISNTASCTAWTAFAPTKSWTLTSGNGTKTVNVWFQDIWDNISVAYSDTIILDTIAPTNGTLTATPGDTQVTLDWTGFTDTGSGTESYKVVSAKGAVPLSCSAGTMIYSGADLSYIHSGLTNGTKYGYRVCAIDKAGNVSTGATASTKPRPESNPPTGSITIKGGVEATKSTAVTLTLTATDESPGAIRMCISNTATCTAWTAFAPTKSWTLTSGNGTKTVNVWFQDVWDNVNPTPYFDTIILDTVAPTNGTLTATPGDTEVMLSWTGFEDTGSGIESYKVVYAKGSVPPSCSAGTMIYSGTDSSYTHKGLTNGTKYGYRVCAIDKAGNVSTGATASTKPRPESNPPTGSITIKGGAEATKSTAVTLTLTATDDTPGVIRMCVSNTATCTAWTAFAPTKSWTLTSGNGTKTVNVWFQDVWDNVNPTPYFDTIILDTIRPANGTVTATPGDTEVMLSWTGFEDTGSGIGSYKLVFAKGAVPLSCSGGTMIYSGTDSSYTHKGLTNGTKYGYRVCAIDKAGNVSSGATASATPMP